MRISIKVRTRRQERREALEAQITSLKAVMESEKLYRDSFKNWADWDDEHDRQDWYRSCNRVTRLEEAIENLEEML